MPTGYFVVSQDTESPKDIRFQVASSTPSDPPEDQLALKTEVEHVLTGLQMLYAQDQPKFEQSFRALLSLAQCGLVGPNAQPDIARRALVTLKDEIVLREAGKVKNRYLRGLGKYCIFMQLPGLIMVFVALYLTPVSIELKCFGLLWIGAVAGLWLSCAYRKTKMQFEDLTLIEEDRLEPPVRIIFVMLITMFMGFICYKGGATFTIGDISTKAIGTDPIVAVILGGLFGFSEQALPSQLARQAASLLDSK
jgi:hypothetical protein